jgi:hypothetical protein
VAVGLRLGVTDGVCVGLCDGDTIAARLGMRDGVSVGDTLGVPVPV